MLGGLEHSVYSYINISKCFLSQNIKYIIYKFFFWLEISTCTSDNCETDNGRVKHPLDCQYPSRLCDNGTICLTPDKLCDEYMDCVDRTDDNILCGNFWRCQVIDPTFCLETLVIRNFNFFFPVNYCDYKDKCSHNCYNAPEGYICGCPENMYLQNDNVTCADTHRCDVWGICSQKCVPIGQHSHKCTCFPEYEIQPDHFTCKSVGMYLY